MRMIEDHEGIGLDKGADVPGALLLTGGLMLGVYTLLGVEEHGWGATQTLALGAVSLALLTGFVGRQARTETPLVPLRLFRSTDVSGANVIMALMVAGFFGLFFLGTLYLQGILGYSPLEVGLAFLPACLVIGWLSLGYAERLIMGIGPRAALLGGLVAAGAGLALFARAPVDGDYWTDVLAVMLLFGTGAGLAFPALMTLAMSGATDEDSGLASGLVNTTMQAGGAFGLAVLATLASRHSDALRADGEPINAALNSGYHLAYLVGAGCVAAAILAALLVLKPASPPGEGLVHAEPGYSEAG
jgi:hypothetical protein